MPRNLAASRSGARPYVVLDRDGTLNKECHHLCDPDQVRLLPTVIQGLRELQEAGLGLVVATNQSVIGRGMIDWSRLADIHARLGQLLDAGGVTLDGIYVCPHRPDEQCGCRKPEAGLVHRAAKVHGFDPSQSMVIGDSACDIQLGHNIGAATVLMMSGYGSSVLRNRTVTPDFVAHDFLAAARMVITRLT